MSEYDEQPAAEGIAIVGMAGRFPGAEDLRRFWRNLAEGVESIVVLSRDELLAAGADPAEIDAPGYVPAGGLLDDPELFDAAFFGLGAREAELMDPQHRLFLETSWQALEDAGYDAEVFDGSIGVYGGMNLASYLLHNLIPDPNAVAGSSAVEIRIRNDKDFLASLAAYKLGLTGPSLTVQSACSTSLVAVSQACQSLLNYQCDMALAGGVSLGCPPRAGYMQQAGVFSPDGHCRAFDAGAQGTVNGQGVGVVVLKRLASALADGDTIRAVIKGYAINNDGSLKVGFTAPSVEGQAEVVAMAQIFAGIDPETVSYVEAHGTGTPMGDPVEVEALTQVFSQSTDRKGFCALGSVKTNIGHLDAAAGVASLIKTTLALEHEILPPSLHFERPNPEIDLASTPFWVPTEPTPWPAEAGKPRRAGVSAFAVGGVNAHLVVEEAPPVEPSEPAQGLQLLPFSARSKAALEEVSRNLARHLEEHPELVLADVAHTLALGRRPFEHRRTVICRDTREAAEILASGEVSRVASGLAAGGRRMVAFLFPGLGNHYPGMARELAEREPGFRDDIERCCRILESELGVDLRDALLAERSAGGAGQELDLRALLGRGSASAGEAAAGELQRTLNAQPALFVVEYALARLWLRWGIEPSALVGYSLGEYVAACLAGVFSLPDALRLIAWRARRIDALPEGAMLAVSLPEPELAAQLPATLSISAIVTPEVTVVGGSVPAMEQLEADLKARAITCRRLETTHAFHSAMMRPLVDSFTELVGELSLEPPQIPFLSNVTGTWITAEQATDPRYWAEHLVAPVRFADAVEELWREPGRVLVEVGPGQVLGAWALQHSASATVSEPVVVASLPHAYDGESHEVRLLHSLGRLWLAGVEPSWEALFAGQKRRRLPLPTYPFERQRYWIDPPEGGATLPGAATRHGEDRAEASFGKRSDVADWLYAPVWRELPPAPWPPVGVAPKRWLLLPDAVGVADALAHELEALGHEVETLGLAGDITDRLRSLRQAERFPEVIAHLPGVTGEEEGSADERETAVVERGFSSLLRLAQAISEVQPEAKLELMVVVDGLCDVTGVEPLEPLEATILGPARVIPQEYPGIVARTFDLAGATADPHAAARQLAAAFFDRETETDLVALRGRRRWVEGYRSIPVVADGDDAVPVKDEAVVLITGGLGGVGRVLAGRLARRARARLALVGRSAFPERAAWPQLAAEDGPQGGAIRELLAMEEAGAEVAVFQADVTDRQALEAVVADIRQRFGRLDGVVHAAGVYPEGMIQLKTPEAAAAVLAPKVRGTRVLTEALAAELEAGLDFFVLCSSLTARLGGFGLVDHVAANAFLDAFAVRATERFGQTVRSVAWDTWLEVGQAARGAEQAGLGSAAVELQGEVFDHPLLERRSRDGENDVFHTRLEARRHWVVDEHRLGERRLLPGTAYLEMARAAFEAVENGGGPVVVEGLVFVEPLWVDEDRAKHMRLSLQSSQNGRRELRIESRSESDDWRENARATVRRGSAEHAPAVVDLQGITERLAPEEPDGDAAADFYLGPRWRSIEQELWRGEAEVLTRLTLAEEFAGDFDDLPLHPALLDWATGFVRALRQELFLPVSYQRATIHGPLSREVYSHVHSLDELGQEGESLACDLDVLDDDGRVRLEVGGFVLRRASTEVTQGAGAEDQGLLSGAFHEGIRPHEGAEVFEHLLSPTVTSAQVLVSVRDFEPWLKHAREVSRQRLLEEVSKLQGRRARHTRPPLATEYAAPRNELETELCELWAELIGLDRVGIHDGFFELGGDSLLATQWIALVKERYDVELSLRSIFEVSSVARQAQLLTELRSRPDQGGRTEAIIERQEGPGPFPLSFHQRQIWLYEQLRPGTPSYNVPAVLRLAGPLRVDLLEAAVGVLVARQDELRATFGQHEGNPVQTLSAEGAAEVQRIDLTDVAPEAREVIAEAEIEREIVRPFDLGRGPLLRTALLQLGAEDHLLVIVFHHLVGDHFSQQILIRELVAFYRAGFEGHAVADEDLGKLTLRYVDYAVWQDQRTGRDTMREQLAYWTSRMAGAPDGLALTTDFPRPPVKGFRGESVELDLAPELGPRLQELATQRGVTPFMVLVGAYFLLLHQHTGQDDLLVGSPITGRNAPGTQDLIGLFAAVVVLRLQLAGNPTLEQVLEQVSEVALEAYDHPELPFEELVAELGVERDLSRSPIFQTMFILQRDPHALPSLPELEIRPWRNERGTSKYDLTLFVFEGAEPGSLRGAVFEYDPGLFAKRRIEAMARDYLRCIELLVTDVELDLAQAIERLRRHGRRERARERKLPKSLPIGQAAERVALAVTANTSREKPA